MFLVILLLLTVVPLMELALLFWVADVTDWRLTLAIVIVTGMLGAALAKHQGLQVWRRIQEQISKGKPPTSELLDGLMILFAGAFLLTPGILTDCVGFLLLTPFGRKLLRVWVARRIVPPGMVQVYSFGSSAFSGRSSENPNELDAEYTVEREEEKGEAVEIQDPRLPESSE